MAENCLPDKTYVAAMSAQNDCPDCWQDCDQCNCSISELDCGDILMSEYYPNIGYTGTEMSCQYSIGSSPLSFTSSIIIDAVTHAITISSDLAALVISLNALGKGAFTLNGTTITALGYHQYGNLSISVIGTPITPSCSSTDNILNLCDFAIAIDTKIGSINKDIDEIKIDIENLDFCVCPNVLYSSNTDNPMPGTGSQTLKTYTVPADTLKKTGDKIIAETLFLVSAQSPPVSYSFSLTPSPGQNTVQITASDEAKQIRITETIIRISNTAAAIKKDIVVYTSTGAAYSNNILFNFNNNVAGFDFDNISFNINAIAIGTEAGVVCKYLHVDILRA